MEFKENVLFLKEFVANPITVSSILPSSKHLAERMVEICDISKANVIVELGCGSGAITKSIVEHSKLNTKIISLDINPKLIEIVKKRFPSVTTINDSAENLEKYLWSMSINRVDVIISSLPWAVFKRSQRLRLLDVIANSLQVGGEFVTFSYIHTLLFKGSREFKKELSCKFKEIRVSKPVWLNIPPAFVYHCIK